MKTYNGKNITKKHIQSVLRTENPTLILSLYHQIYGGRVDRWQALHFIEEFAPSNRVYRHAYNIALAHRARIIDPDYLAKHRQFSNANRKHLAMVELRKEMARQNDGYSKRPMMGHTHLYFCSPEYRHRDYNKWRALPIEGNERFCELICKVGKKYIQ